MHNSDTDKTWRIRALNDAFRKSMQGGRFVVTQGVNALPGSARAMAIHKVVTFDAFTTDNDPHGEHDFGAFDIADQKFFWKIDAYDSDMQFGSGDPSEPAKTTRVLTIMLAEEY